MKKSYNRSYNKACFYAGFILSYAAIYTKYDTYKIIMIKQYFDLINWDLSIFIDNVNNIYSIFSDKYS